MNYSPGTASWIYLYDELWADDVKLLWCQDTLLSGHVLQDHSQIDQAVSHHVLVLSWKDVPRNNFGCREPGQMLNTKILSMFDIWRVEVWVWTYFPWRTIL